MLFRSPYDDGLEAHVAGFPDVPSPNWNAGKLSARRVPTPKEWLSIVKKTREAITQLGIKAVISPRATYIGLALIKQNVSLQYLEKGLLYKSMSLDTIAKIRQG